MRNLFILLGILFSFQLSAQYTTAGTSLNWNFDSLANHSTAVSKNGNTYQVTQDIVISLTDTLRIDSNIRVELGNNIELEILGSFISNPKDSAILTAINPSQVYDQIRFDGSDNSYFNKTTFEYGGGLNVLSSNFTVENCVFQFNEAGNDGAIDLFRSNLIIRNNRFIDNQGPAISSGANIASAPQIINNYIESNVANGGNKSQINFGTTGSDTLIIKGNTIKGQYTNAGGIAIFPIGNVYAVIDSNVIDSNRYGIALLNANIWASVSRNIISNNNIQNNPNLGGSGINVMGNNSTTPIISENKIYGNLWGITIQNTAKPNIGDLRPASYNVGLNEIYNNGNGGSLYNIFNNTPDSIYAQNNIWNYPNLQDVENTISHKTDDPNLGYVLYTPVSALITSLSEQVQTNEELTIYPNPSEGNMTLKSSFKVYELAWYNLKGQLVQTNQVDGSKQLRINETNLKGYYILKVVGKNQQAFKQLILE